MTVAVGQSTIKHCDMQLARGTLYRIMLCCGNFCSFQRHVELHSILRDGADAMNRVTEVSVHGDQLVCMLLPPIAE